MAVEVLLVVFRVVHFIHLGSLFLQAVVDRKGMKQSPALIFFKASSCVRSYHVWVK